MNYFEFLMVFVGVPLVIILLIAFRKGKLTQFNISGILVLSLIALIYTTPWDNYLIFRGVWTYPPDAVVGKLGYVPLEEYGFMILQTWLAGVLFVLLPFSREIPSLQFSPLASLPAFFLGALGCVFLMSESGTYAGLILVWACPPLALQWSLGLKALIHTFKLWFVPWVLLTIYLCLADAFAISKGIWSLNPETRSGWDLGNLPVEEALFFTLTNLFVIQGLCLWHAWRKAQL